MNEFVINVAQDPSTIININNSDGAVSLDIGQNQQNSITIEDDVNNVLLNPSVFYNGINIVYLSGVSGELLHNTFGDLQGGAANQYYHLSSGQYFNLTTGSVIRPNETGAFYPRSNPSGFITGVDLSLYVTGSVVRPSDTGNFITISQTGSFYPRSNPSGYITGVDLSNYVTGQVVRPSETGVFYPTSNPSGYITGVDLSNYSTISFSTGISGHLQNQVTNLNNQTGSYYPRNNPSGYITGVNLSGYVTGDVIRPSDTGAFYPATNPSGYITGVNLSSYATIGFVTGISGYLQPQITNLNNQTGSYATGSVVRPSETGTFITQYQTGQFYAASNPSGFITGVDLSAYITGINNIVYTTGDQTINGIKTFTSRPTLNGTGFLLSGEAAQLPETIIYSTGNQDISGIKNFLTQPTISGNPIATISNPVRTTVIGNGVASGYAISGASGLINPSALIVAIDGAMQEPIVDYILNTGSIFFTSPLPSGSKAVVVSPNNIYQVAQLTPSDGSVTSSKLDNSIQINNLTVANNFISNGDFTGNSTRNNLPNQTLVNSGSILTRDLMAMFLEKDIYYFSPTSFSASTAISGASVTLNSNAIFLRGNNTTQASPNNLAMATVGTQVTDVGFMGISNSSSYLVSGGGRGGVDSAYSVLDFRQRVILQFELSTNFKHVASNHNFFARLGPASSALNTNTGQALPGTGLGVGGAYVAMLMETGSIRLVTNKNLQTPTESPNQLVSPILASLTPFTTATAKFSLSVYSGTADLYIGNQYIGSQTGCPTHVSTFSHGIAFGCNSLATTTVVGAGYVVSNIKIITLPN
jgi:hypothetical protein